MNYNSNNLQFFMMVTENEKNFVPECMRDSKRWIRWYEDTDQSNSYGKHGKKPYCKWQDPENWETLDEVFAKNNVRVSEANGRNNGVGFVLGEELHLVVIDIDNVDITSKNFDPFVKQVIEELDSYTEASVSHRGIHIVIRGKIPEKLSNKSSFTCRNETGSHEFEIYSKDRWIAITGHKLNEKYKELDATEEEGQKKLDAFVEKYYSEEEQPNKTDIVINNADVARYYDNNKNLTIDEIIQKLDVNARNVYHCNDEGKKYLRLKYPKNDNIGFDFSKADARLAHELCIISQDYNKIENICLNSGLAKYSDEIGRKKSGSYWKHTIKKELEYTAENPRTDVILNDLYKDDFEFVYNSYMNYGMITDNEISELLFKNDYMNDVRYVDEYKTFIDYDGIKWNTGNKSTSLVSNKIDEYREIFTIAINNELAKLASEIDMLKATIEVTKDEEQIATFNSKLKEIVDKKTAFSEAKKFIAGIGNYKKKDQLIKTIANQPRARATATDFDRVDKTENLLNFEDVTYCIKEDKVVAHNPDDFIAKKMNIKYDTCKKSNGMFRRFFDSYWKDTEEGKQYKRYFMEAIGYILTGVTTEKVIFFLFGEKDTGKSTLLDVLWEAFGDYCNVSSTSLVTNTASSNGNTPELEKLKGLRGTRVPEMSSKQKLVNTFIKVITGERALTAQGKYRDPVQFVNTCKIIIETNEMPRPNGSFDAALYRRIKVIPCEISIPIDKQDPRIREKILQEDPQGIAEFAIECIRLYMKNGLENFPAINRLTDEYKVETSTTEEFVNENLDIGKEYYINRKELLNMWSNWNDELQNPIRLSGSALLSEIKKIAPFIKKDRLNYTKDPSRPRVIRGIRKKTDEVVTGDSDGYIDWDNNSATDSIDKLPF